MLVLVNTIEFMLARSDARAMLPVVVMVENDMLVPAATLVTVPDPPPPPPAAAMVPDELMVLNVPVLETNRDSEPTGGTGIADPVVSTNCAAMTESGLLT